MQSQEYLSAKWALALRAPGLTGDAIDEALAPGDILRTHILRPTWHFVTPDDIRWLLALTGPRIDALARPQYRQLDLNDESLSRMHDVIVDSLSEGAHLTRAEIGEHLARAGIEAASRKLGYIAYSAEVAGHICSGPMVGKQHTYALLADRAPELTDFDRDEALGKIASMYVRGHGPAQPRDLSWWSSLTLTDSRRAFDIAGLRPLEIDDRTYWTDVEPVTDTPLADVFLLPPYDEYVSYFREPIDPSRLVRELPERVFTSGFVYLDGQISGRWRRTIKSKAVDIDVELFVQWTSRLVEGVEKAVIGLAEFLNRVPALTIR